MSERQERFRRLYAGQFDALVQVDRGDYPEVFWGMADELRAGSTAAEVRGGVC
ncbi:hypothetical protein NPS01_15570 [Nocardioides psychrotolerans]|uniref:Uncharacterized protein n=1 Tax=Nocardioides psychrotolerans TaxID=1005945 RepID=A0A1I3F1U5_9ACTN|nr:hypothetical protein [Nocardioides psychrotolerans]GEP37894.1 hypothetical protein NPS01_15570 [Nocardioides psychrotolerans]SFI05172.1 hypothetical protein SAMN05216561_104185 [Nocardioides psychrotolerans]